MSNILKGRFEEKKFKDALERLKDFEPDVPGRQLLLRVTDEELVRSRRKVVKLRVL